MDQAAKYLNHFNNNKLMEMMRLQDDDYVATYLRKAKFKMISVPVLGIQEDTG